MFYALGDPDSVEPTVNVFTIATPHQNSASNGSNEATVVRSERSSRPARARANSESDLPPSYAEAVSTDTEGERSGEERRGEGRTEDGRRGGRRDRPNRY